MTEQRPDAELEASYRFAKRQTRKASSTFYLASWLFARPVRRDLWSVYAFCRIADDIADAPGLDLEQRRDELELLRHTLKTRRYSEGDLLWPALFDVIERYQIDSRYFFELLDGVASDLEPVEIADMAALERYSYLVAGTVGIICAHILSKPTKPTLKAAEQLGIAMQITNIMRDVSADTAIGRIYLPRDICRRHKLTESEIRAGVYDERTVQVMTVLSDRANQLYAKADAGIALLDQPNRRPVRVALRLYQSILERIEQKRFRVYNTRVRLNALEKLAVVVRTR